MGIATHPFPINRRSFGLLADGKWEFSNPQRMHKQLHLSCYSMADTCKNCAKCDKGFNIGTYEAFNIKIKSKVEGISRIF